MAVDYDLGTARGQIVIDSAQLGRASQALTVVGRQMIGLGVLAAAGFVVAVKSAADFEHQMSAVAAVLQGETAPQFARLKELALELGSTTVFSAGEIAGAMEALAKAGVPVQDMLNGAVEATVNLAAAAGDELPGGVQRAAEIISNAQKVFNASADELAHFADVLVGAAASSTLSVEDLAVSFRYAGPIAAQLGLSIDDLNTVLAILGDRGIRGSTAGTSLRGVLLSLTPTSDRARDAMRDLGLITEDGTNRFYDLNGALKPIPEVMQILGDATANLSEQEKVAAFNAIFQRRAMSAALILAEQGADGFLQYAEAIGAIDAADVAATKIDNLSGDILILKNSINTLLIRAGQPFQDMVRGWVQGLTDIVNKISELDPELLALILQIGAITGVVLIAGGSLLLFASWLLRMYRTILILKEALGLLIAAGKLLTITFLTNPIVLIIAAIIALAALLYLAYQRSEQFREAFDAAFDHIQPTIEAVVGWVQNFVSLLDDLWRAFQQGGIEGNAFASVLDKMGLNSETVVNALVTIRDALIAVRDASIEAFDWFADNVLPVIVRAVVTTVAAVAVAVGWIIGTAIPAIIDFGQTVGEIATDVAGWFNDHVMPTLVAFGQLVAATVRLVIAVIRFLWPVFEAAGRVIMVTLEVIVNVIEAAVDAIILIWTYLGDNIIDLVLIAFNFIKGLIESTLQILRGIFQFFAGLFTLDWSLMWQGIQSIVSGAWTFITTIVGTAIDLLRLIIETALDLIVLVWHLAWDLIGLVLSNAWTLMTGLLGAALDLVLGLLSNALGVLHDIWFGIWHAIWDFLVNIWGQITQAVSDGIDSVIDFVGRIPGRAQGALAGILSTLLQKGKDLITGLLNGVIAKAMDLFNWFIALPGNVKAWLGDLGSTLLGLGGDLIQGLIDGIRDKVGDLMDYISGIAGDVADAFGGVLGIFSPSRVFMAYGEDIIRGLVNGLAHTRALERQMAQIAGITAAPTTAVAALGTGSSTNNVSITFEFPNVGSAEDAEQVEEALSHSDVLNEILHAARAGVGGRQ